MSWMRPAFCLLGLLLSMAALAQPEFPKLSGQVVDQAEMLSAAAERDLTQTLAGHERATGNQLVVVTVPDLQGYSIEDYGYQLGRHWGIGQKGEDNGALLLVAEEEREIRIEVGYGLEGQLTDAISSQIIFQIISPAFKQGNFEAGISRGVEAMIKVLGGESLPAPTSNAGKGRQPPALGGLLLLFVVLMMLGGGGRRRGLLGGLLLGSMLGGGRGGFGGGGFGGGGFGGGGGGFGGGGASGGW